MVLNILSTGAMVRLGYVYGNLMVNLHRKNSKLAERSVSIVQQALGVKKRRCYSRLRSAKNNVPAAIVMAQSRRESLERGSSIGPHRRPRAQRHHVGEEDAIAESEIASAHPSPGFGEEVGNKLWPGPQCALSYTDFLWINS